MDDKIHIHDNSKVNTKAEIERRNNKRQRCNDMMIDIKDEVHEMSDLERINNDDTVEAIDDTSDTILTERLKWITTIVMYFASFGLGMLLSVFGPTLLDLKDQLQVDITQVSIAITMLAAGYLVGAIIGGFLTDRYNPALVLGVFMMINMGFLTVIPFFQHLGPFLAYWALLGFGASVSDTVMVVFLIAIWGRKSSPFVQFLFFAMGVGTCISPLLANLFVTPTESGKSGNDTIVFEISFDNVTAPLTMATAETAFPIRGRELRMETDAKYVYVIIGSYLGLIGLLFCGIAIKFGSIYAVRPGVRHDVNTVNNDDGLMIPTWNQMNKRYGIKMLIFVFLIYFAYGGFHITISGLVTTFAIHGLHWTKDHGTIIASVYGGAVTLSCVLGVFATKILSLSQMISIQILTIILSMIIMVAFVQLHASVLWVTIILAGLASGSLNATIYSWFQTNVMQITGIVASSSIIGKSLSAMSVPLVAAALMENVHYMCFSYLILGIVVLLGVVAICIYVCFKIYTKRQF
ncbi:unnamed protein product [Owenia fusiformis]|uniref:Uncharacterized protein n=1 Tax=Owenia fusiformis TaxID=6347 RepID=A0A8S4NQD5_OWEFU|nr:unnamed protein product [Owenia fusiformis]